ARFRFFASSVRKEDAVGDVLEDWDDETLTELPEIETTLNGMGDESVVQVGLQSAVSTMGTLVLHCVANDKSERWKLEFDVRNPE
ncbi:MAG: hypothetical protein ACI9OJ_005120, partial [Myxococcota bacterium]